MIKRYIQKLIREEVKAIANDPSLLDQEPVVSTQPDGVLMTDMTTEEYEEYRLMEERGWRPFYKRLKQKIYGSSRQA